LQSTSTILPLPSSPHWRPNKTSTDGCVSICGENKDLRVTLNNDLKRTYKHGLHPDFNTFGLWV